MLTVGSLFSGIGGIELGLERTGYFKTIWQVENDDYCNKVLAKHWPKVRRFGDIRTVKELPYADLICGGFPCQDISVAGKGKGITGERSGLWKEFLRIIRMVRPRYVFVENVSALTIRGLDVVLADLAESGYDAEWNIVSAASVGAPHRRERIFIVANAIGRRGQKDEIQTGRNAVGHGGSFPHHDSRGFKGAYIPIRQLGQVKTEAIALRVGKDVSDSEGFHEERSVSKGNLGGQSKEKIGNRSCALSDADNAKTSRQRKDGRKIFIIPESTGCCIRSSAEWWTVEPEVGRVADGVSARVDRLKCLGNAVVPQVAEAVGRMIMEYDQKVIM